MEVTLNTNHSQAVSTQCSKTFSGMRVAWKKKKTFKYWSRFLQISWPKQDLNEIN